MESLSGSAALSGKINPCLTCRHSSSALVKLPAFGSCCSGVRRKEASLMLSSPSQRRIRLGRAFALEASGGSVEENGALLNGLNFSIDDGPLLLESELPNGGYQSFTSKELETGTPATFENDGLFRSPILGGVLTATSTHNLPQPSLDVRNLMEQARFGQLCTIMSHMHHHRIGYPTGSLVDFIVDSLGHPVFSLSPLAMHTRNLLEDSRCSLLVQIPGWSSLSNARVTIFGDVFPLEADQQEWARQQFAAKHLQWASQQWSNFYYYRMQNISDIYFIGGFGTVAWVDVKEYETMKPDKIAAESGEQNLKELNAMFSKKLKDILSTKVEIDDAAFISVDSKGTDVRVRQGAQFSIRRISFEAEREIQTLDDAKAALVMIIKRHRKSKSSTE
ncbi:uncharacterized protein LOC122055893 [Zingiber officinale]|uniref:CREG-like beta-barrel domain-containing protein n=1 Tax=Zingiber officinale TaxID=94328 RepID=A0A8J5HI65_ZINOF|nr:uncharacterized protein LOC122055893 [Zingiber officinale]KAG6517495.1 hypothetical protein ZIOFF_020887 [Zingiber officinale]